MKKKVLFFGLFIAIPLLSQDNTAPLLTGFSFVPDTVDVTSMADTVAFTIEATDDNSGLIRVFLALLSPSGERFVKGSALFDMGSTADTTVVQLIMKQFSETGDWVIEMLNLFDLGGNNNLYDTNDLQALGFPTTLHVISVQDTTPPTLTDLAFSPDSLNVILTRDTTWMTVGAADNLSGLSSVQITFQSPSDSNEVTTIALFQAESLADTTTSSVVFHPYAESGLWDLSTLSLYDVTGNVSEYTTEDLKALGFSSALHIESVEDVTAPTLVDFDLSPNEIILGTPPNEVTFTVSATDDVSGLFSVAVSFAAPTGFGAVDGLQPFHAGSLADIVTGTLSVGQIDEAGDWIIRALSLTDVGGNSIIYLEEDLQAMGFPTTLTVTENGTGVEVEGVAKTFHLLKNYPNPFNPTTTLAFTLPELSDVTLTIFSILGERIRSFDLNHLPAGKHVLIWDGRDDSGRLLASGIYFYRLKAGTFVQTRQMLLMK